MLHHEFTPWISGRPTAAADGADEPIVMMAYRSRAVHAPTERELDQLLRKAQERNRTEHLSGLLIYDQGYFFQWIEGPSDALGRVWHSIQGDPRHREIEVLREQVIDRRFFGHWDMRLARRVRGRIDTALAVLEAPEDLLKRVRLQPSSLGRDAWDDIFADLVVPRLRRKHLRMHPMPRRVATLWHAEDHAAVELAGLALAVDGGAAAQFINGLVNEGANLETLFCEVFEPAARHLGGLRADDRRTDFEIHAGLGRLQFEVRRLGASLEHPLYAIRPNHSVLIAPEPGEPAGLGSAMSSELFWRDGWEVSCEFPASDAELGESLKNRWFDVLDLSLSTAMRSDRALTMMSTTIRAAHAASLNPALMILVDGRAFFERPQSFRDVGADAACVTVVEAVPAAHRLLTAAAGRGRTGIAVARPRGRSDASAASSSMRLFERQFRSTVF
jgi:hypothetical protein